VRLTGIFHPAGSQLTVAHATRSKIDASGIQYDGTSAFTSSQFASALEMGSKHAAWCLGCCWALMAGLFALGVMSITWMALIAALIGLEKTIPWRRAASWGTGTVLIVLAVAVLAAPGAVPGLVIPTGGHRAMQAMGAMR
jgi:peptidoglycan/LPS O-acetylase OafA/YrhL